MLKCSVFALALGAIASASAITFDFEDQPGTFDGLGVHTSMTLGTWPLTATFWREFNTPFDVVDVSLYEPNFSFPSSWGTNALSPFHNTSADWRITFETPLTFLSFDYGDFGQDEDGLDVAALDENGNLLDAFTTSGFLGNLNDGEFGTATFFGSGIKTLVITGSSSDTNFPNSLYLDNFVATPVPEPASMAVLGLGLAAFRRRRARG